MDLERILQLTPGTISKQWYSGGAVTDPGTVTVGITAADGTVVVAPGTATAGSGTAARTFNLTTVHTALLDRLTVTWTSTLKGTQTSTVEVVGGFLFTLSEMRVLLPDAVKYPNEMIQDMRTLVEQAMEEAAGTAFVPRYEYETLSGDGGDQIRLSWANVTSVRSVTVDGASITPTSAVVSTSEGWAYYSTKWAFGYSNAVIGYEHGHLTAPARIAEAALFEARYRLTRRNSPTDDRTITTAYEGGTTILQQPGRGGMQFFLPETDAAVAQYNLSVGVA